MISVRRLQEAPFPSGADGPRPWWGVWEHDPGHVYLAMPCGKHCVARLNHTIDADGTVTPSAACPLHPGGFHEFIRLEGWKP